MGSTQQFSLRWNNYLNHITGAFDSLRSDEDLVDVTLSCEGKRIRAHKMLLSACSSYFRDLFKENPCQHPVIIFRNVKYEDLVALVDFMYQGEVNVEQEQLTSFLTTAELLAVQGLSEGGGKKTHPSNDKEIDLCDSPDESQDPPVQVNNSNHRSELKASSSEISSAISFFPLEQSNTPPSKRRKWSNSSGLVGTPKSSAHTVKISEKDCDLERRRISQEQPPCSPQGGIEVIPSLKVELPEYIEEDTVEQDVSYTDSSQDQSGQGGLRTSVDPLPNVSQLLPPLNSSSDTKAELDTYCSNSGEAVLSVGDSVSGADLSQILSKAGPSNENQSQDSLQEIPIYSRWSRNSSCIDIGEPASVNIPAFYTCPHCEKTFKNEGSLSHHMSYHRGQTKCVLCGKTFGRIHTMKLHMLKVHDNALL